jgi:DNA repair exonuclease SbcCD ATPase subunit
LLDILEKQRGTQLTLSQESSTLKNQEKSIKKLEVVPCTSNNDYLYPSCHYIKDAYEDKQLIDNQRRTVEQLVGALEEYEIIARPLIEEDIKKKLSEYSVASRQIEILEYNQHILRSDIEMFEFHIKQFEQTISSKRTELNTLKSNLNASESTEYKDKSIEYNDLLKQISLYDKERNELLLAIGKEQSKVEQLQKEKQECQVLLNKYKIYDTIQQAFSKNGIPAMVLKSQLPAINQELEKILANVVDFKISLETEVATNTLDIFIKDEHSKRVIELGSGMEKMICSIALRAALSILSSLPKPDIFIIDESFGVLDSTNIQAVIILLQQLKAWFKTILIITHVDSLKEAADSILEISYDETNSFISFP